MDILRDFFLKRKSSVLRDLDQWNLNKEVSYTILEEVVHNVIDEYFSQLKKRTKQLSLGKPFVMLRNKKMIDTYLNRKLYNYIGILYKIKDKVTGKYYYGITRNSMKKRWEAHKTNTKAINMNKASLDYFIYELIQKLIKQGFSVDQAMLAIDNRFERIPLEIAFDIFTLIDRERTYIKYAKSYDPKNCFNIALGGALRGVILVEYIDFKSLAYYLAKGYNPKQIAKETGLSKYTVYRSINLIWGGWYEALDLLLKPTVEKLIKKGYDRKYIAGALSSTDRNNYKRLRYRLTPDTLETWCCERWWPDCNNWTEVQKRFLKEIFDSFVIRGLNLKKIDKKFRNLNYQQIKYRFRKMYRDDQGQGLAAARRILIKPLLENALKNKLSDAEIIKILELENWLPFGTSNQKITDANRLLQRLTEEIYFTIYFKKQNYQERIKYFYGDTPTNLMRIFFETGLLNLLV